MPDPTYRKIGDHTEAIEIDFAPSVISFEEVLSLIWASHNPLRNFGGRQYRHAIWYHGKEQKMVTEKSRDQLGGHLGIPVEKIQTAVEPIGIFTYAEDYHQKYLLRRQSRFIDQLLALYPDHLSFTDSAVATRLNGWFGNGSNLDTVKFREEVATYGLPDDLTARIQAEIV